LQAKEHLKQWDAVQDRAISRYITSEQCVSLGRNGRRKHGREADLFSVKNNRKAIMSEQTDRELLKLAAKAIGKKNWQPDVCYIDARCDADGVPYWNPLKDDGDALRLAVQLNLLRAYIYENEVSMSPSEHGIIEPYNGDPYAATRRAIVRAAAQIGKDIP